MKAAARSGDIGAGHDNCENVAIVTGSSNVFIDGKPAARCGDIFAAHDCLNFSSKHPKHIPIIVTGSSNVFIDGKSAARCGDKTDCFPFGTGVIESGSDSVFID